MAAVLAFKKRALGGRLGGLWAACCRVRTALTGPGEPSAGLGGACPAEAEAEIALPPKNFSLAAHGPQSL
jgi:hypothetical protein